MNKDIQASPSQAKGAKGSGLAKCLAILCIVSFIASVIDLTVEDIAVPSRRLSSVEYYLGEIMGGFVTVCLFSSLFFAVVRLIRGGSVPTAGLGTGIAAALLLFYIMSKDDLHRIEERYNATHVEDVGSSQR